MVVRKEIEELKEEIEELKRKNGKKKQEFKLPGGWKRTFKASKKKQNVNKILFMLYKENGKIIGPKLVPYHDNVVVHNYKAYEVDPRAMWDWGKYKAYAFKETDRRPISNLDLKKIKERGDLTDSDEILIKAVMRAVEGGRKKPLDMKVLFVIGAIVVGIIVFMMSRGGSIPAG